MRAVFAVRRVIEIRLMVAQCVQGTVSLASLAVEHGMNLNVLHRWVASTNGMGVMRQATASC